MTGKTRCFWLLNDRKTVREITMEEARKQAGRNRHVIYVHGDSEFYTTKKFVSFSQFNQCISHLKEA